MVDSDERRDFRRMGFECALEYRQLGGDAEGIGKARNLSSGGLLFTCADPLGVGDRLAVRSAPDAPVVSPLRAVVRVLRVEPDADSDGYRVACVIEQFDE